jgi:hypothetical protein
MNNPKKLATLGKRDKGQRQTKQKHNIENQKDEQSIWLKNNLSVEYILIFETKKFVICIILVLIKESR